MVAESILVMGPPKTGKSYFLSTVAKVVPAQRVLLLATKPREAASFGYRHYGIKAELIWDNWYPELGLYEATGYKTLLRRLYELQKDSDYDAVLLDVGTDAVGLAGHSILAPHKATSPTDLRDPRSYYGQIRNKMKDLVNALVALTFAPHPKLVMAAWHTQALKQSDESGSGVAFEGSVLPAVEGSYREAMAGDFNIVLTTAVEPAKMVMNAQTKKMESVGGGYVVQVKADQDRHVAVSSLPAFDQKYLPNDFELLWKLIEEVGND